MHEFFANPFFDALRTEHAHLAIGTVPALRYPSDVIPFAALAEPTPDAMLALAELLAHGEVFYLTGDHISSICRTKNQIEYLKELPGWQYHFPSEDIPEPTSGHEVRELTAADSAAMVALTDVAFPGYFRPRAYLLGPYYGIYIEDELIAMAGTRVCLPGYREISAICTHPQHVGRGHAAALTRHILRANADAGLRSFLHVLAANHRAIALYERLGFTRTIPIQFHQMRRR